MPRSRGGTRLPEHKVGTQKEWQTAREELAKLEAEQAELNEKVKAQRLELPWVPVEKEYELDTEEGKKSLAELFDGRSQLLAYNVMLDARGNRAEPERDRDPGDDDNTHVCGGPAPEPTQWSDRLCRSQFLGPRNGHRLSDAHRRQPRSRRVARSSRSDAGHPPTMTKNH